jgi:hypothetical protein
MTSGSGGLTIDAAFGNTGILEALGTGALIINGQNLATNPASVAAAASSRFLQGLQSFSRTMPR